MDVPQKLNEEITTALPVTDAVGTLKPGVYVMIAKPSQKSSEDYNTEATQWFIVSDLGLTAFSGDDGVHAFVRSLADDQPVGRRQRQADRPQQRGARHRQDRRARLRALRRRPRRAAKAACSRRC